MIEACVIVIACLVALAALAWLWRSIAATERRWRAELKRVAQDADLHCSYIEEPREEVRRG